MAQIKDRDTLKAAIKRRKKAVYEPVKPEQQLGFVHHNVDCIGCRACEIACKDKNGLPAGPRFRRVQYVEGGTYPDVYAYKVNVSCNHCAEPACLPTCPTGAIWKRKDNGIVDIDDDSFIRSMIAGIDPAGDRPGPVGARTRPLLIGLAVGLGEAAAAPVRAVAASRSPKPPTRNGNGRRRPGGGSR